MDQNALNSNFIEASAADLSSVEGGLRGESVLVGAAIGAGLFGFTPVGGFIGGAIGGAVGALLDWLF